MKTGEFLRAVWPATGLYVIAIPTDERKYKHHICNKLEEAIAVAITSDKSNHDVFFAVHSFRERYVVHPKTGKKGTRFATNALNARCFYLDLDVGEGEKKYSTRVAALAALREFVKKHNLPKPFIVSSGGGFHVYFVLTEDVPSVEWLEVATKFKLLTAAAGLKADPARTSDRSSVLRVVGTHNHKHGMKRPVECLANGLPISFKAFSLIVESGLQNYSSTPVANVMNDSKKAAEALLGNNTKKTDYPPLDFRKLATSCKQIGEVVRLRGNVPEPQWYHALQVVRLCENWRKAAHFMSSGHPKYDPLETDEKLNRLAAIEAGPTTCTKFDKETDYKICPSCPHYGKILSPARLAHVFKQASAPTYEDPHAHTVTVPDPPYPYIRLQTGAVGVRQKNDQGAEIDPVIICDYDIFPERRVVNEASEGERLMWRVKLPRSGWNRVEFESEALYDLRKFIAAISSKGIYPHSDMVGALRNYMLAYIQELQRFADAEQQYSRLGWRNDYKAFVIGPNEYKSDGSVVPCSLDPNIKQSIEGLTVNGALAEQVRALDFYDKPGYEAHQFCILAALGAPLMPATPHNGMIVNLSGASGVGKTTVMKAGASLWGHPEKFVINGTKQGSTQVGMMHRLGVRCNLPFLFDDITRMNAQDVGDIALSISQGYGKIRGTVTGGERKNVERWSTIMITSSNNSIYDKLSHDRSDSMAEAMRVFEIDFLFTANHTKAEADAFQDLLYRNHGHIGAKFISYCLQHREKVFETVRTIVKRIDAKARIVGAERFWSAGVAAALAAGLIARKLGLLHYDLGAIERWVTDVQIPAMRGVVVENTTPPEGAFADFLEMNIGNTLVIDTTGNIPVVLEKPRGQLLCRHEYGTNLLYILKKAFKDYCHRNGINYGKTLNDMVQEKLVLDKNAKKVLGAGTDFSKGQTYCILINLNHKRLAGIQQQILNIPGQQQHVSDKSNLSK